MGSQLKRLLILFVTLQLCHAQMLTTIVGGGPAAAPPITFVSTGITMCAGDTAGSGVQVAAITLGPFTSTGGNFIVVWSGAHAAGLPTIVDSKLNTWTQLTADTTGSFPNMRGWYAKNATVGTSHTITVTGLFVGFCAAIFSGVSTSTPRDGTGSRVSDHSGTTNQPGSVTPAADGSLLITATGTDATVVVTNNDLGLGFTQSGNFVGGNSPSTWAGITMAYKIQGTAAAQNPTFTYGVSAVTDAVIDIFK